jgi:hypothetical protein
MRKRVTAKSSTEGLYNREPSFSTINFGFQGTGNLQDVQIKYSNMIWNQPFNTHLQKIQQLRKMQGRKVSIVDNWKMTPEQILDQQLKDHRAKK